MRCYHFGNYYLSQIQQGIQAAHAQMEMFVKYQAPSEQRDMLYDWAENHKTMVCLTGGNSAALAEITGTLHQLSYPNVMFSEDENSLNGALTNVAVVVPTSVVETRDRLRKYKCVESFQGDGFVQFDMYDDGAWVGELQVDDEEFQLIEIVNSCRLA
jgi:hypothetical protein